MRKLLLGLTLWLGFLAPALAVTPATRVGDANYTVANTDTNVITTTAFTAARTWTLPAANATCIGQNCQPLVFQLQIQDLASAVSSTNTLTLARPSGGTINGAASDMVITYSGAQVVLYPTSPTNWQAYVINAAPATVNPGNFVTTNTATALGSSWNVLSKQTLSATGIVSGNGRGGRRELDLSGTVTGGAFISGGQDKLIVTGTMNSADSRLMAGFSQLDGSAGTFTAGQLAAHWNDMGATAPGGGWNTGSQSYIVRNTNTTSSAVQAIVEDYGKASFWHQLDDNGGGWLDSTTGGTTQTGRIKVQVGGQTRYLHVFSD